MTHQSSVVLLVALLAAPVPGAPVPAFLGHLQGLGALEDNHAANH